MARRSDHSREEIREMSLAAAEAIVAEEGYRGLSARKIATRIGYTVGTLYLVFKNLSDLVVQVNGRTLDTIYEKLAEASAEGTPGERINSIGRAYIQYAQTHSGRWNMLYEYVLPEGEQLPEWYLQKLDSIFTLVGDTLKPLGEKHEAAEYNRAARVLWAGVHGICVLQLTHRLNLVGDEPVEQLTQTLIDNFLKGFQSS